MSRIYHDSPEMERLAMWWHRFGMYASAASVFFSAVGVIWHFWAIKQHEEALRK